MGDPRIIRLDRVMGLAGRIVGVSFIFLLLIFLLFWPILIERHSDVRAGNLATACDYMVAQPECWPAQANTDSTP